VTLGLVAVVADVFLFSNDNDVEVNGFVGMVSQSGGDVLGEVLGLVQEARSLVQ